MGFRTGGLISVASWPSIDTSVEIYNPGHDKYVLGVGLTTGRQRFKLRANDVHIAAATTHRPNGWRCRRQCQDVGLGDVRVQGSRFNLTPARGRDFVPPLCALGAICANCHAAGTRVIDRREKRGEERQQGHALDAGLQDQHGRGCSVSDDTTTKPNGPMGMGALDTHGCASNAFAVGRSAGCDDTHTRVSERTVAAAGILGASLKGGKVARAGARDDSPPATQLTYLALKAEMHKFASVLAEIFRESRHLVRLGDLEEYCDLLLEAKLRYKRNRCICVRAQLTCSLISLHGNCPDKISMTVAPTDQMSALFPTGCPAIIYEHAKTKVSVTCN